MPQCFHKRNYHIPFSHTLFLLPFVCPSHIDHRGPPRSEHNVKGDGVTLPIQYYSLAKSLLDMDQSFITAAKQVVAQTSAFTDIFSPPTM